MDTNVYLHFDGNCEAAFNFYEKSLGGKIQSLFRFEGSPMASQAPPEWGHKVMHGSMMLGDSILMGSDVPPGRYSKPHGFSINLGLSDAAEAERIFKALSENGEIHMPMGETFWAVRFGMLTDQFGIPWMVNVERPM